MDYKKHYNTLCERAKNRNLHCYIESHHIIPKCLGGEDCNNNLVKLTPEEHYVAHQLLVKMYPNHKGLVWAALQMTGQPNGKRNNNKLYGWLRRKYQHVAKKRTGKKNGSYGRKWYYHPETLDNIKCLPEEIPEGYIKGRKLKPNTKCLTCGEDTGTMYRKYCKKHVPRPINITVPWFYNKSTGECERFNKQPHDNNWVKGKIKTILCKGCKTINAKRPGEEGYYSEYCSEECREHNLTKDIKKETELWYTDFKSGNYSSLRDFCRKNNIRPMTASKRFRKYIDEY